MPAIYTRDSDRLSESVSAYLFDFLVSCDVNWSLFDGVRTVTRMPAGKIMLVIDSYTIHTWLYIEVKHTCFQKAGRSSRLVQP